MARNPQTHCRRAGERRRSRRSSSLTRQAAERERFVSHWIGGTVRNNDTLNLRPSTHPQWQHAALRRESERGEAEQEELFREVLLRAQGAYTAFLEPDSSSSQGVSIRMVHVAPCTGSAAFFSHTATRQTSVVNLCTGTHTYINTYIHTYMYIHTNMHACIHTCMYTYIHT